MMGTKKNIYKYFIKESVGFFLMAFIIGAVSSGIVNAFTGAEYVLSLFSVYAILNLIVAITVKGFTEREYSTFGGSRKDLVRINIISDFLIAVMETALLGGIIQFAHSFKKLNESLRIMDLNETMGQIPVMQFIVFIFLLVMGIQSVITFDFMSNKGVFRLFFSGKKQGTGSKNVIIAVVIYVIMTILLGLIVACYTQTEKHYLQTGLSVGLLVITVVFYIFAVGKAKHKEFYVENA